VIRNILAADGRELIPIFDRVCAKYNNELLEKERERERRED
jgi:predicted nucleic acid-binding Zn ribbon protein